MWVLGLHKVHGEESIVVLLVHGELILLFLTQPPPWLILVLLISSSTNCSPLLLPLHSQSHHSFFIWRPSLLLNKVHSNLKLPLLTLTTNGSFLFLVPPFFPQSLTLRLFLRVDISSASDSSILIILSKSACILSLSLLHCLIHPQPFSFVKHASLTVCHLVTLFLH
ncbi:unnamed protein product [Microthlaspi erraticum]|uniref:Uncharacterized protein n=1 Tax=Microthlaspi erraticum TaxID=1685480 RepID=A0A6D2IX77_9BRAS|nr:unnamed protein product [Microthlaspi erraticum]